MDGFEHYKQIDNGSHTDTKIPLSGTYQAITGYDGKVPLSNFQGRYCFKPTYNQFMLRKDLPKYKSKVFFSCRFYMENLPDQDFACPAPMVKFVNSSLGDMFTVALSLLGQLVILKNGIEVARSISPVFTSGTWHFMEIMVDMDNDRIAIRNDDNAYDSLVYEADLGTNLVASILFGIHNQGAAGSGDGHITDVHIWDGSGTRNNSFLGDTRIYTLKPNRDIQTGWSKNSRKHLGTGIGNFTASSGFGGWVSTENTADFSFGSGDYTIEGFFRFSELPTGNNHSNLIASWADEYSRNNFRLAKEGEGLGGKIVFQIALDHLNATTVVSAEHGTELNKWYHISVSRASGVTRLFVDGELLDERIDTYTYPVPNWTVALGALSQNVIHVFKGFMDEIRVSKGVARYTENFAIPSAKFGRNTTDDPDFGSVIWLIGFDGGFGDESSYARATNGYNGTTTPMYFTNDDGDYQYQSIASNNVRDDTYITAAYNKAENTLTLTGNPSNDDTVTIGSQIYVFKNILAAANDILIGANAENTLTNLRNAINGGSGEGTIYGTGTIPNPLVSANTGVGNTLTVYALSGGVAGNSIAVSESTSGSWGSATLLGGSNIPPPSSFGFDTIPPEIEAIRAVEVVTRAWKTESGTGRLDTVFVGVGGGSVTNGSRSLSSSPLFYTDIFETDPDGGGVITPSSLLHGAVRYNRSE